MVILRIPLGHLSLERTVLIPLANLLVEIDSSAVNLEGLPGVKDGLPPFLTVDEPGDIGVSRPFHYNISSSDISPILDTGRLHLLGQVDIELSCSQETQLYPQWPC